MKKSFLFECIIFIFLFIFFFKKKVLLNEINENFVLLILLAKKFEIIKKFFSTPPIDNIGKKKII